MIELDHCDNLTVHFTPDNRPAMVGTLHFISGKLASGKTTLARKISVAESAVLICEDEWLTRLFDGAHSLEQYLERRSRIRVLLTDFVPSLLAVGTSVVFDFSGNTVADRAWVRSVFDRVKASHRLHYIEADDSLCLRQLAMRNEGQPPGIYWGPVTQTMFHQLLPYFSAPEASEGFSIVRHVAGQA